MIDISIIIVSYNVKEFILNLIDSINKAAKGLSLEIIIVDNASIDGSVDFFRSRIGDKVKIISLDENLGFARANNKAFSIARGKYLLVINPDTIVKENTLKSIFDFMEENPGIAITGCKLLNLDGTFAPESKRAIPNPASAFWRMLGLNRLFPKSRFFAEYYVPWVDENEAGEVPAISGAFMFCRASVIKEVNGFDEQFFMYGEDLDLCKRVSDFGKIFYFPGTSIIHYKGESTKTDSLDYTIYFYKAMIQFFSKHYGSVVSRPFQWLVMSGVFFLGIFHFTKRIFQKGMVPLFDTLLLNLLLASFFILRYSIKSGFENVEYIHGFFIVHILATLFYLLFAYMNKLFSHRQLILGAMVKCLTMTIITLAAFTFFIKELAFSRLVIGITYITSLFLFILWRIIAARSRQSLLGKYFRAKVIVVGGDPHTENILQKLKRMPDKAIDIQGIVINADSKNIQKLAEIPVIGTLENLTSILEFHKPEMVVFMSGKISYNEIMENMEAIARLGIQIRIIPENMEVLIGKSFVEHFDDLPMVDFNVAYWTPLNRIFKRSFDLGSASVLFILLLPLYLIFKIVKRNQIESVRIRYGKNIAYLLPHLKEYPLKNWRNIVLLLPQIIRGVISWCGASFDSGRIYYSHFVGITGPVQQYPAPLNTEEYMEVEKRYLVNYSIGLDLKYLLGLFIR